MACGLFQIPRKVVLECKVFRHQPGDHGEQKNLNNSQKLIEHRQVRFTGFRSFTSFKEKFLY